MAYIKTINGFEIWESDRHGKCVKGRKQSSSIKVRHNVGTGYILKKQVSFPVGDPVKRAEAITKCEEFILTSVKTN